MVSSTSPVQQQLDLLRKGYAQKLAERVQAIESCWNQLLQESWSNETLATLYRLVHSLAGSGATFGFSKLSNVARALEVILSSIQESRVPPLAMQRIQIHALLASLKQAAQESEQDPPVESTLEEHLPSADSPLYNEENRLIYLMEDDADLAQDLALQISHFGYQVRTFSQAEILRQAVEKTPPAAIISDIVFPDHQLSGTQLMTEILQTIPAAPPVLFISVLDDLNARLQVARTGGKAYFTKPVNVPSLIDKLDELTARRSLEPFRILFVDDESHLATYYALILRQAGMITTVVIDPQELMATLTEFNPDLILMDIYMPLCSGPELAAVIRQQQAYVGIPIVFLSTETDLDKQLVAMSLGGDDFLTKPIQADHLILSITARAQRARTLRSLMTRDSLTGLLNHTKIKDQLTHEVLRADRQKTQLAYAMIDLDHFKSVNDSYGHASGDRVIKSLARLLQQRLRKTDIIGRYGGEEFAVILPETTGTDAVRILNEIRLGFAQVRQRSDQAELSSTFSCGIATFPQFRDVASLSSAADRALYQAKYQGRNQVVLATGGEAS